MYITENLQKRGSDNFNIRRSVTAIPDSAKEEGWLTILNFSAVSQIFLFKLAVKKKGSPFTTSSTHQRTVVATQIRIFY